MKLTEAELLDFLHCPIYYQTIHKRKLPFKTPPSFNTALTKISNSFFLRLMNGQVLQPYELKKKWDRICTDMNMNPKKCMDGIGLLNKMFLWAKDKQIRIADIGTPYSLVVPGARSKIEIRGETGAVAMNSQGGYELLVLDFSSKYPDQSVIDLKLRYTMDCYAFKRLYSKELGIHVHHVKDNKDFYSYRKKKDYERMIAAIDNAAYSIEHNITYPRESAFCASCGMKEICRSWLGQ